MRYSKQSKWGLITQCKSAILYTANFGHKYNIDQWACRLLDQHITYIPRSRYRTNAIHIDTSLVGRTLSYKGIASRMTCCCKGTIHTWAWLHLAQMKDDKFVSRFTCSVLLFQKRHHRFKTKWLLLFLAGFSLHLNSISVRNPCLHIL